ncbi:MAG: hypothetical protein ABIS50_18075 [Luteolibacter sp.]|uniref:hypothetical protein n=1 Tax=Luteolibacter sp. TaxID=1962973 RepID=UPI003267DDBB
MASDSITFFCPACSIKLTVPGSLAGVIGPCPSCRSQIQAPYPAPTPVYQSQPAPAPVYQAPAAPAPVAAQAPAYQPAPAPVYQSPPAPAYQAPAAPQYQPTPSYQPPAGYETYAAPIPATTVAPAHQPQAVAAPVQSPQLAPHPGYEVISTPVPAAPAPPVQEIPILSQAATIPAQPIPAATPAVLRPEPRQLPNRSGTAEPVAKPMPETNRSPDSKGVKGRPPHSQSRARLIRLLVPLLFILPVVGLVFGVLTVLKNQTKAVSPPNPVKRPTENRIIPEESSPPKPAGEPVPVLPVPAPELPSIVEPPPDLPEGLEPVDPGKAAEETLDKFLAAKSLPERLPLIETKTTEPELAKSCLANPFPASSNVTPEFRETNAVEQVIDFYYNVDFDAGNNRLSPYTILVRKRGDGAPKIVADPFLDSYGGRLAAYAKTPSEKAGIFEVIIYAVASCNDENVPNREKKLTLKLLPRDETKEIARAYFGRQSKIGRMLEDGTYSLSFGKARACTVMLRWNTEDRPETPYLEAIDLKTLDWNP